MKNLFKLLIISSYALFLGGKAYAQCSTGETEVKVVIVEDDYGSDIEWKVTGVGGSPVYLSGGPYIDGNNGTTHTETVCIPSGTNLVFNITDVYADGICCVYGNGSYTVYVNECKVVASGGEYGSSETKNFSAEAQPGLDLEVKTFDVDPFWLIGNTPIQGTIINNGTTTVNSFTLNYSINNGAAVTQNITGVNIASCSTYNYNHSTPWNASLAGSYDIKVWVSNVNGGTDENNTNDSQEATVYVIAQLANRLPLIEEFTSSTCLPCAAFNTNFDPFLADSLKANKNDGIVAAIKYQMDWPSPGNDPSYNADGEVRNEFYDGGGIPKPYLDGALFANPTSMVTYNTAIAKDAFMNIDLSYSTNGNQATVTAVVTPYAIPSGTIKLYLAVTEDYYRYEGASTSQKDYHYAMRKMLPDGNGITLTGLTAGTPITKTESYTFNFGSVTQGGFNIWGEDLSETTAIAFVQNTSSKEIYQAAFANALPAGINENEAAIGLRVYPNPLQNEADITFELEEGDNIHISLHNTIGQEVYTNNLGYRQAGRHSLTINAKDLNSGIYFLNITVGDNRATTRLSITK